ncbi:hypothetical protein PHLGIDRAFT_122007 [Phlebiopsis gigantea 11061_1 CR5-6]|uniref:Uncharacterized protein n=1 Tax=Phlebiopsis gigantea (strain 11061_1 CR5-6) TaxID=745531 RepID=A0A0C3S4H4_PHLG1|nr:hypothetical protein PHLGIDRAFT_122007 [Phlebiopsis gigantea 11061_1 CR5-6]
MVSSLIAAYTAAEETLEKQIPFTVAEDNKVYAKFDDQLYEIVELLTAPDIRVAPHPNYDDVLRQDATTGKPAKGASVSGVVRQYAELIEDSGDREGAIRGAKKAKM